MIQVRQVALETEPVGVLNVNTREGMIRFGRGKVAGTAGPDDLVAMEAGGTTYLFAPDAVAVIGRWFLSSGIALGVEP